MGIEGGASSRTPKGRDTPMLRFGSYRNAESSYHMPMVSPSFATPNYRYSTHQFS